MVDTVLPHSPFTGHPQGDQPTRSGALGVHLTASVLRSVTLVSTWHGGVEPLSKALQAALGVPLPTKTGQTVQSEAGLVMRCGPQEFMLVSSAATDMTVGLRQSISADVGSVTNLSHARCRIQVTGVNCLYALPKLFALDLREDAFPINEIRLTGHHHVPCTLHRLGASAFDLYVFSTYAHDQLATLLDAALEYGVRLKC